MNRPFFATIIIVFLPVGGLMAEETTQKLSSSDAVKTVEQSDEFAFFETKIRPVLVKHCYDCHSVESGTAEGGLRVDDRAAIRAGGGRGPAVVPGRPAASLLLTAISHADTDLKMPPKSPKLPDSVIDDFRRWIKSGAADPREENKSATPSAWAGMEAARTHWAYQPLHATAPPDVENSDWPRQDLDQFILARLRDNNLSPTPDASPEVFVRRLYFDLIGLPPAPDDVDRFRKQIQAVGWDAALETEVDQLLDSPRFGERWGRHWLDVARFGESSGKEANIPFPHAWRYRDYVIDSINAFIPIDRFLTEQIAGDLLPFDSEAERARLLIATGFLAVGTKNLGEQNDKQFKADIVDEQIDSLSRGVLASSIACARCHDHKFDPFAMRDYYGLAGIFHSTKTYFGTFVSPASQQGGDLIPLPRLKDEVILHDSVTPEKYQQMKKQLAELQAERIEMDEALKAVFAGKKPKKTFTLREALANIWRTGPLKGKLQTIDEQGKAIPVAMGAMDDERIEDVPLLARGEVNRPGEIVPRAFPQAIELPEHFSISDQESGRLELARWITHPEHPLTSRVFVNRVWQKLFGAGLVRSVDNFGTTGDKPTHPQLLDTLAVEFVAEGWPLKQLVRKLVLSRTYRQASNYDRESFLRDPDNRFLWRMPKRRLEAEAIRDAMLAVSGELDTSRPQGSLVGRVIHDQPISLIGLNKQLPSDLDGAQYRSVYLPVIRERLPDVLDLFDFAEPSLVTGVREQTNVPVQALYLMNGPFVQDRARALASRLLKFSAADDEHIRHAFRLCYSRDPDDNELKRSLEFLVEMSKAGDDAHLAWSSFCQSLLSTAEFRNID